MNGRIFENTTHTVDSCVFRINTDILFWIGLFSDREKICVLEDDDTYLQDFSPVAEGGTLEDQEQDG